MDRDEFNKYVRLISRRLYSLAFRILRKQDEAEDAVQEVFIRLWKMNDKLDTYNSVEALATTMIKNYCIDQVRKSRVIFENEMMISDRSVPATDELIENAESYMIIQKIISSMASNYREIIIMRDIDQMSYEEIVEKTGQNINTIRVNLSRARAIVRKEYSKYFNEKRRN